MVNVIATCVADVQMTWNVGSGTGWTFWISKYIYILP